MDHDDGSGILYQTIGFVCGLIVGDLLLKLFLGRAPLLYLLLRLIGIR